MPSFNLSLWNFTFWPSLPSTDCLFIGSQVSILLSISPSGNFHWLLFCQPFTLRLQEEFGSCSLVFACSLFSSWWSHPSWGLIPHAHLLVFLICHHFCTREPLIYVFLTLPFMDISHKWSHSICGPLGLASFTEHNIFEAHSPGGVSIIVPFYCWVVFHHMDISQVFIIKKKNLKATKTLK